MATKITPSDSRKWFPSFTVVMGPRWMKYDGKRLEWCGQRGEGTIGSANAGYDSAGSDRDIDANGGYSNARREYEEAREL